MSRELHARPPAVRLSSVLDDSYREHLEGLLFFNPGQERVASGIEESIARHGVPEVIAESGYLHIRVGALGRIQALFAFFPQVPRDELAGVILYCRLSVEEAMILHVAVAERFASTGALAEAIVALRLVESVRQAVRHLKGVRSLSMYHGGGTVRFAVSTPVGACALGA